MHKCPQCGFAYGGEVPDVDLGKKKEAETGVAVEDPDYQIDVYRGENAKKAAATKNAESDARFAQAVKRAKFRKGQQ